MWRRLLGVLIGLLIGVGLGILGAILLAPPAPGPAESNWLSYPTAAEAVKVAPGTPLLWDNNIRGAPELRYWMFLGLLLGGGFGALTGAVVSAGGIGIQSSRETRSVSTE